MDLSILIPVYNTKPIVLRRCIDSIRKIKDYNYEIIIIDDGSSEKNSNEYSSFCKKNKHISYYRKDNGGVSSARNFGLKKAKGKYILFVDSDDILMPENIDFSLLCNGYDIVFYNLALIKDNVFHEMKEVSMENSGEIDYLNILNDFVKNDKFYAPCAKFISKKFILKNDLCFNTRMINGEDAIFNLNMLLCKPSIYYCNKTIYGYYYDISNYDKRVNDRFDSILSDYLYKYNRKNDVAKEYLEDYDLIRKNENDAIGQIFKISMICVSLKANRKKEISKYIKQFNFNPKDLSFKNKMKYYDMTNKLWFLVYIVSKIRRLYILLKWKA